MPTHSLSASIRDRIPRETQRRRLKKTSRIHTKAIILGSISDEGPLCKLPNCFQADTQSSGKNKIKRELTRGGKNKKRRIPGWEDHWKGNELLESYSEDKTKERKDEGKRGKRGKEQSKHAPNSETLHGVSLELLPKTKTTLEIKVAGAGELGRRRTNRTKRADTYESNV